MRRGLVGVVGLVLVGAWGSDCGPPPVPLTGSLDYTTGCHMTMANPPCNPGGMPIVQATAGSGTPPAIVTCAIAPGNPARVRFSIGRSASGSLSEGDGISVCGSVNGPNQDMFATRVQLYFSGDTSPNNPAPGVCQVHIADLSDTAFSGSIQCTDAPTQSVPPKLRYIQGTATTADPLKADFSFLSCTVLTSACPQ